MLVNIYKSATIFDASKKMFGAIDNGDISVDHVVIVPDRFSLIAEKLLLDILPQKALFNVRVKTLTTFSLELIKKFNLKTDEVLSTGENLLLTQQAIENVRDKLLLFKKSKIAFCYEMTKLLSQLKSSNVAPEDLNENAGGMAGDKYHDLKIIYTEQKRLQEGRLDVNERLALLNGSFVSGMLDDTIVYFAGFDAFTKEGYQFIKNLIKNARAVNLALSASLDIGNDYIYDKDIASNLAKFATECGASYNVFGGNDNFSPEKDGILRGVYSYSKVTRENNGFYNLYSASNISEEVEAVAKLIRYNVFCGEKYKNIQIAVGGLDRYAMVIENIFDKYQIPYYIDTSVTADNTILGRFILEFFDLVCFNYSGQRLENLLANVCLGDNQALISKCQKLGIDSKAKYKKYIEKDFAFSPFAVAAEKCHTIKEFNSVVRQLLDGVKDNFDLALTTLEEKGELKEKNINVQMPEIFEEVLALLDRYDAPIEIDEYITKLKLLLSFKEVSTVPTYVDSVMIGDASESFFAQSNLFIIMGAQSLPVSSLDNGLLSDEEMGFNLKEIEPTIRMINRRNRFKTFSLLSLASKMLVLTYQRFSDDGKKNELPSYIVNLNDIFDQLELRAGNVFFTKNPVDLNHALLASDIKANFEMPDYSRSQIEGADRLYFKDGLVKVTELENYFSCPFKHFATYGLKLKEKEVASFDARDIGNICHRGAELFIKDLIKNNFDFNVDLDKFINTHFDKILGDLKEKLDYLDEKKSFTRYIKRQLKSCFSDIIREMKKSSFRPVYLEKKFEGYKLNVDDKQYTIIGRADRIDFYDNYFRIIDYKTGSTGTIIKDLYYGQKLQLFLYQKIAQKEFNKIPAGAYYFNAKLSYSDNDEDKVILKGVSPNYDNVLKALDNDLSVGEKSSILPLQINKDGFYTGSAVSKYEMNKLLDYSVKISQNAIKEIVEGYVGASPIKDGCQYCKYASLCQYEKSQGVRRKSKGDISF